MATYGSVLQRCPKWYSKLSFEVIWRTNSVDAHFLYNEYQTKTKITITEIREKVITTMLGRDHAEDQPEAAPSKRHNTPPEPNQYLIKNRKKGKRVREQCAECFKKYERE
ncbi:hypothetical protein JTB14_015137 [Gonioctena quinquepunctata]|nr:hypothetical protein JTB14_015137 [Gonioctena quinquepunctata]